MRFEEKARRLPAVLPVVLALCAALSASSAGAQTVRQVSTDSLIYDLKNPDAGRRTDAARQLGTAKFVPSIPALLPLTEDPDAGVRRQVELAFEEMNDIQTLPGFVQLSADSEADIRDRSVHALVNLHLPRESGPTAALMKFGNLINPWLDEHAGTVVEPDVPVDAVGHHRASREDERHRRRHPARGEPGIGHPAGVGRDSRAAAGPRPGPRSGGAIPVGARPEEDRRRVGRRSPAARIESQRGEGPQRDHHRPRRAQIPGSRA